MPFSFFFPTPIAHFFILVFLTLAAIQDYKTGEVSNWITIPLFLGGAIVILANLELLLIILSMLLLFFWHKGWMGGADVKVLVALLGFWSEAAFVAFFLLGAWGLVSLVRKKKKSFPCLVAIAAGTSLTFFREISIMFSN